EPEVAVADADGAGTIKGLVETLAIAQQRVVIHPALPIVVRRTQRGRVAGRVEEHFGDTGRELVERGEEPLPGSDGGVHEMVRNDDAEPARVSTSVERCANAGRAPTVSAGRATQSRGEAELGGHVEVRARTRHIVQQGVHVAVDVRDVDPELQRPGDL